MSAGVRDVANLCWKLAAVLRDQAPDSLLDSYQAERKPHVTEVTRRACLVGRIITERNSVIAAMRNHVLRALTRLPGVNAGLLKLSWIPDARYTDGFFAAGKHRAVGWQIPQPWVTDASGATVRLDDVLGGQWTILHTGAPPPGTPAWAELGVPTIRVSEPAARPLAATQESGRRGGAARRIHLRRSRIRTAPAHTSRYHADQNWSIRMTTTELTEHTVTVNGRPIFVAETGTGPAVVMLHGGGPGASGVSNYSRNIDALAQQFRVIVPDMPGYGRSVKGVDQDDPFGYLADVIRGLLDELGIDTAHLIGNSYGGAAALRLALDTPHRVGRLVLMGPGGIGTTRGVPTAGLKSLLAYYGGDGPSRDKLETFIRHYLVYDGASVPDELIDLRYQASIDPEVVANPPLRRPSGPTALRTLWRMDLTRDSRLKQLPNRTLVLWGRDDKVNRPAGGPMLLNLMPNAELVMTSHTGHWMQWERAELFNHLVTEFLLRNRRSRHVGQHRVRKRPPRLHRHRDRQVRRLEAVRPRRHRHASRRDSARCHAVPAR